MTNVNEVTTIITGLQVMSHVYKFVSLRKIIRLNKKYQITEITRLEHKPRLASWSNIQI